MTTNKPIRVQIKPQIVARLEPIKPEHQTMAKVRQKKQKKKNKRAQINSLI